ncbi:MAG: DUF4860 domain-containing protein [Bacillota bacterium]|nr:DUF4860 domain-containing protein [Bacillota bacterium]
MKSRKHYVDIIFIIALIGVFAMSSVMLTLLGVNIYKDSAGNDRRQELNTASLYFAQKIRQCDDDAQISITSMEAPDANAAGGGSVVVGMSDGDGISDTGGNGTDAAETSAETSASDTGNTSDGPGEDGTSNDPVKNEIPALLLASTDGEHQLETRLFVYNGWLKELTSLQGSSISPQFGQQIMELERAEFRMVSDTLLEIRLTAGKEGSVIKLRLDGSLEVAHE